MANDAILEELSQSMPPRGRDTITKLSQQSKKQVDQDPHRFYSLCMTTTEDRMYNM